MNSAHLSAIIAFSLWGLFPIYWKVLSELSSVDLFSHRIVWSFLTLGLILLFKKKAHFFQEIWREKNKRYLLIFSALMISTNWLIYIYAVNSGKIIEASLGYFLNPIINIVIGRVLLNEQIRRFQWPSILLAVLSLAYILWQVNLNEFPWIALSLSITFALYSVIRKLVSVGSLEGLAFETSLMIIPVGIWWLSRNSNPLIFLEILPNWKIFLLSTAGIVTSLPLILFAYGAKRINLSTLGFIQYLSPSLKFICGLVIFHEPLSQSRLTAFIMIWIALAFYTLESFYFMKNKRKV
jgi:chloramphenicol-sensitive protein RarD